jgi:hypothetical protein
MAQHTLQVYYSQWAFLIVAMSISNCRGGALVPEIGQLALQAFASPSVGASPVIFQGMNHPIHSVLLFLEQDFQTFESGFTALTPKHSFR